jgi:transcriptional regulator of acetoin/glycerol metabolism
MVALKNGVKFSRSKQEINEMFLSVYKEWKSGNITATEGMKGLNMKPNTFYRRVKKYESTL